MKMLGCLRASLRSGLTVLSLLGIALVGALGPANAAQPQKFVAGQAIVWVRDGAGTVDEVNRAMASTGCTVIRSLPMTGVYLVSVPGAKGAAASDAETLRGAEQLKALSEFRYAGLNSVCEYYDVTPNDTRYKEQWHLPLMRVPAAWDIEKGQATVVVGVIDSGCDITHPDLVGRLLPGINTGAGSADDMTDAVPHGTHVIGIIAAATNNGLGVAGVTYEKVKVLPIKSDLTDASLIASLAFAQKNGVQVVNGSFGAPKTSDTPDVSDPISSKILEMAKAGVVFCFAAGNAYMDGNPASWPANLASVHKNILCVAACGPLKEHSVYSQSRSYTTIAAPGGNDADGSTPANQILSTLPAANSLYGFEQGTSMASPACAGVVALMLSAGATPDRVRDILILTADKVGKTVPNNDYGYGVVDAAKAVAESSVSVTVVQPDGTGGKAAASGQFTQPDPVETLRPVIRVQVSQILQENLTISLNGSPITDYTVENIRNTYTDKGGVVWPLSYDAVISGRDVQLGSNVLTVSGVKPGTPPRTATDTRNFVVSPHQIAGGRSMISVPYLQAGATPESYFGSGFSLARWLPSLSYAVYSDGGPKSVDASFSPTGALPHPDGQAVTTAPVGLAYWADMDSVKPVVTRGAAIGVTSYVIPLKGRTSLDGGVTRVPVGWNMVGDPFPYDVPFNACLVDTPEGRLTIGAAVEKGYLLGNIYTYSEGSGYAFRTLPDGLLRAWAGHWVGVLSDQDLALVVPPLKASRAAVGSVGRPSGGWSFRLGASSGKYGDLTTVIGVSSSASDTYDKLDVLKPPMPTPGVSVGVVNDGWSRMAGSYAQDMRSVGGTKSWSVSVASSDLQRDVTFSWSPVGGFPRGVRAVLTDPAANQSVDMRTRAAYSFRPSPDGAPKILTITTSVGTSGVLRLTNLAVRPGAGRASAAAQIGFTMSADASYEVQVLGADGRTVGAIGSRASGAGDVRLVWDGKDKAGRAVPAGTYLVQVKAVGLDGEVVRVIRPFALTR